MRLQICCYNVQCQSHIKLKKKFLVSQENAQQILNLATSKALNLSLNTG